MIKNVDQWIGAYLRQALERKPKVDGPIDVYFSLMDHYEPYWNGADKATAMGRVKRWCDAYPGVAARHRDADGKPPQHSYFYPEEEYDADALDKVATLCRRGLGDVEIHLHHDNDTSAGFREKLERFKKILHERHGFLKKNPATGQVEYAFIHGNWALDNSSPGGVDCGVNDELIVLKETGCYADFTMPSAPHPTQTSKINSIYYAIDDPEKPKSHDTGRDVAVGNWNDKAFLLVQGPLALNWSSRKLGIIPRIENAELTWDNPPTRARVELWGRVGVHVKGRPDAIFIKTHTHSLQERNLDAFFDRGDLDKLYSDLEAVYSKENGYRLHYVTARETVDAIKRLASGHA